MLAPRVLRELSWAASKLREVARALSAMEVRLTVVPECGKMTALEADGQGMRSTSLEASEPGWVQTTLPFREEYSDEDLEAEAAPAGAASGAA